MEFISTTEAAEILGISRNLLIHYLKKDLGGIRQCAVRFVPRGRYRIRKEALLDWKKRQNNLGLRDFAGKDDAGEP